MSCPYWESRIRCQSCHVELISSFIKPSFISYRMSLKHHLCTYLLDDIMSELDLVGNAVLHSFVGIPWTYINFCKIMLQGYINFCKIMLQGVCSCFLTEVRRVLSGILCFTFFERGILGIFPPFYYCLYYGFFLDHILIA
jgi:hypothetical protein